MGYPNPHQGHFVLDTDACDVVIGTVLTSLESFDLWEQNYKWNRKNYWVTDKELLDVRYFIEYLKQYLLGQKFILRSDHKALVWPYKLKEPKGTVGLSYYLLKFLK